MNKGQKIPLMPVSIVGLPECNDDDIFLGSNQIGFTCVFNKVLVVPDDHDGEDTLCVYETPEEAIPLMTGLYSWVKIEPETTL